MKRKYGVPLTLTREELLHYYVERHMTVKEIEKLFNCGEGSVYWLIDKYGIQLRGKEKILSKEDLYQLHVVQELTAVRIGEMYGCHNSSISRLLTEYGLNTRRQHARPPIVPPVPKEELYQLYVMKKWSCRMIAENYHVNIREARGWLKVYDIPVRTGARVGGPKYTSHKMAIPHTL